MENFGGIFFHSRSDGFIVYRPRPVVKIVTTEGLFREFWALGGTLSWVQDMTCTDKDLVRACYDKGIWYTPFWLKMFSEMMAGCDGGLWYTPFLQKIYFEMMAGCNRGIWYTSFWLKYFPSDGPPLLKPQNLSLYYFQVNVSPKRVSSSESVIPNPSECLFLLMLQHHFLVVLGYGVVLVGMHFWVLLEKHVFFVFGGGIGIELIRLSKSLSDKKRTRVSSVEVHHISSEGFLDFGA